MGFKDHFRRSKARTSSTSSTSQSTNPPTPSFTPNNNPTPSTPAPAITLTKTSSRLSKTLTFRSHHSSSSNTGVKDPYQKKVEDWQKKDAQEWKEPKSKYPGRKSQKHQDVLRAFEWSFGRKSRDGRGSLDIGGNRKGSAWSGVSPGTSRVGSVDDGGAGIQRVVSSERGVGGARRESGRVGGVGTVVEE